ncbi:unnamed protein product, partial [Acanthoscelides obtectus]
YSHILSFRRQVYIEPNQQSLNIPDSIEITHENLAYRIFLSLDSQKCFKCSKQGHIASQCPLPSQQRQTNPHETQSTKVPESTSTHHTSNQQIITTETQETALSQHIPNPREADVDLPHTSQSVIDKSPIPTRKTQELIPEIQNYTQQNEPDQQNRVIPHTSTGSKYIATHNNPSPKRYFSETISPTTLTHENSTPPTFAVPKNIKSKKHKTDMQSSYISQDALATAKTFIDNQMPALPLNSDQFKSLLENSHGTQDITNIIKDYTDDIKGLIEMILLVYPHITDKTVKNRCTRLRKKLERYIGNNTNECLSDTSSIDSTF